MNGNFRKPEFVKRYEYNYYDLETPLNSNVANNARQTKNNYRFEIDNSSEANPIDWYNAYLEVDFKLVQLANSAAGITARTGAEANFCTTTNGQTFIKEIQVECNGITVYNNTRANESANILSMLKYTKSYADTVGKDQFFFVDSSTGNTEPRKAEELYNEGFGKRKTLTDAAAVNNISIPLNLYSYFAAFKNNLHPNLKTNIKLTLENDDNIIFRNTAAPAPNQFFFVDTSTGTAQPAPGATYNEGFAKGKILTDAAAENNISIPLNLYSYFAAFRNNLHPNLKINIKLTLENDDNIILRHANAADSKVILTKLRLWIPKIIFNEEGLKAYLAEYLKPKTWIYHKEHQEIQQSGATNDSFRISTGIRRPRHVFIWAVPTLSYNNQGANIFTFALDQIGGNQSFARAQLEMNNSMFYPQLEFSSTEASRLC